MPLSSRNVVASSASPNKNVPFTHSGAYTVGAGAELLAVAAMLNGDASNIASITAVRWEDASGLNPEPLTQAVYHDSGIVSAGNGDGSSRVGWWVLPNPTARVGQISFDVEITSGTVRSYSFVAAEIIGGVNTASPVGATAAASGTTAAAPLSLTSTVADALLLSADIHRYFTGATPFTPDAGVTELTEGATGGHSLSDHGYWVGERLAATPGAYNVGVTASASDIYAIAAIEIKPAATGGASVSVPTAWRIRTQADAPVAWRVMAAAAQAVAWRVRAAASIDTAWRVMASTARSTAWRVLARVARPSAWRVMGRTAVPTAWRLLTSRTRAVAWRLLRRTEVATGWRIGEALALRPEQTVLAAAHPRLLHADVHPRTLNARR